MNYTLAQVRGWLDAIERQERSAHADTLILLRASQAGEKGFKEVYQALLSPQKPGDE